MSKINLTRTFNNVKKFAKFHSPEILTGLGITGMITTTVMAVKATPKALILLEEKKEKSTDEKLTPKDIVSTTWKCYIPATATGVASILCLIGANSVNAKRNMALATAYSLSELTLRDYKNKVIATIGEKKETEIQDKIAEDKVKTRKVVKEKVLTTGKGDTLCYDTLSGRYFKSDIDEIRKAINEINHQLYNEMYVSLNDFYYVIGLDGTVLGNDLGWHVENGLIDIRFSSQLANGEVPCLVLDYTVAPKYGFNDYC